MARENAAAKCLAHSALPEHPFSGGEVFQPTCLGHELGLVEWHGLLPGIDVSKKRI